MINSDNTNIQNENLVAEVTTRQTVAIDVEKDFNGDLAGAIASADDGDVVMLGAKTYETSGITIDKDITIDGHRNYSVVDGGGTLEPIFSFTPEASGATIQGLEITNGNTGIQGDGATDLTLKDLEIHNIGISDTIRQGQNNSGINLFHASGFQILDSKIHNIGRKGVGINDTNGGTISGLTLEDINLDAEHAQSFDAAGIKLFNTNEVTISDNNLTDINAFHIWNDITNSTIIESNVITGVGDGFLAPEFNPHVTVSGIYNEKSYESAVIDNDVSSNGNYLAFDATAFTTETMIMRGNNFSNMELDSTDWWANEEIEKLVAITEDPSEADFSLFEDDFFAGANIG